MDRNQYKRRKKDIENQLKNLEIRRSYLEASYPKYSLLRDLKLDIVNKKINNLLVKDRELDEIMYEID